MRLTRLIPARILDANKPNLQTPSPRIMASLCPYTEGIAPTTNSLDLLNNEHVTFL